MNNFIELLNILKVKKLIYSTVNIIKLVTRIE